MIVQLLPDWKLAVIEAHGISVTDQLLGLLLEPLSITSLKSFDQSDTGLD